MAELGPDILRELDLAMAEQLATLTTPMEPLAPHNGARSQGDVAPPTAHFPSQDGMATMPLLPLPDEDRAPTPPPAQPNLAAGTSPTARLVVPADLSRSPRANGVPIPASDLPLAAAPDLAWSRAGDPLADSPAQPSGISPLVPEPLPAHAPQAAPTRAPPPRGGWG